MTSDQRVDVVCLMSEANVRLHVSGADIIYEPINPEIAVSQGHRDSGAIFDQGRELRLRWQ